MFLTLLDLVGTHVFGFPVKERIGNSAPKMCSYKLAKPSWAKAPIKSHTYVFRTNPAELLDIIFISTKASSTLDLQINKQDLIRPNVPLVGNPKDKLM